jgi:transposase
MDLTNEQITKLTTRLGRDVESFLRDRTVEKHYSADSLAELVEVSPRTVWTWIERYEASGGKEGLGPVVKLSHKNVRIPASAINRMLAAHTVDAGALAGAKAA